MYLKSIQESLDQRWTMNIHLPNTSSFTHLLQSLRPTEKDYISVYIMKKEWNLGSPIVLDMLQESGILKMTDYITHKIELEDPQEVQLIFNDLLETQFKLLANLVENIERTDPKSQLITQYLDEGFRRFIADISTGDYCPNKNCLFEMKSLLTNEQLMKVRILNLKLLLDMEDCSLAEAISRLGGWLNDMDTNLNKGFNELIKEILCNQEKVLDCLMKKVFSDKFHGWKWYTIVLCKICSELKMNSAKAIKSFLKELNKSFLVQKNKNFFFIMMITARVVCCGDKDRFGDYSQWYKTQFSEMRYRISKDDFVSTMEMLQALVSHENDMYVLEIYVKTPIAPPTLCNELVLSFKQMCRSKIERLKLDLSGDRKTFDSVVLVDDDDDDDMEF